MLRREYPRWPPTWKPRDASGSRPGITPTSSELAGGANNPVRTKQVMRLGLRRTVANYSRDRTRARRHRAKPVRVAIRYRADRERCEHGRSCEAPDGARPNRGTPLPLPPYRPASPRRQLRVPGFNNADRTLQMEPCGYNSGRDASTPATGFDTVKLSLPERLTERRNATRFRRCVRTRPSSTSPWNPALPQCGSAGCTWPRGRCGTWNRS